MAALKNNPKIAYVEEDAIMTTLNYAVNPELANSWGVERIGAGIVQTYGNIGHGVKVTAIYTGINYYHNELTANLAKNTLTDAVWLQCNHINQYRMTIMVMEVTVLEL